MLPMVIMEPVLLAIVIFDPVVLAGYSRIGARTAAYGNFESII